MGTDDLGMAARALSTGSEKRRLDPMEGEDYREYYLARTVDVLMKEALAAHQALWPAFRAVAEARAAWGRPAVIEGWALLPELVAGWLPATAWAVWLVLASPAAFERRLRACPGFYRGASDEEGLIRCFAARSVAFDVHLRAEAARHGFPAIEVGPDEAPQATLDRLVAALADPVIARPSGPT